MFEEYKKQRNHVYYSLFKKIATLVEVYVLVLMVFMCIFFDSAKPLWLLLFWGIFGVIALGVNEKDFTKDNQELYLHSGGLFFVSYAQFMQEAKGND